MIELTWVGDALRWAGGLYWLLAIGALALAITKIKPIAGKVISVAAIVALFGYLPITAALENKKAADARKAAWAHFEMRCKSAGEKIYKTVEDVEGIMLLKIRPEKTNFSEQFVLDDPYGRDLGNDGYIESFLNNFHASKDSSSNIPFRHGYKYVEAIDSQDSKRYRYLGSMKDVYVPPSYLIGGKSQGFQHRKFVVEKAPSTQPPPRYGVTYDDISTLEDRNVWIAGSSLRIIDLQTNEVIAERIGYMLDREQGNTQGGRSPWLYAADNACPTFARSPSIKIHPGRGASAQLNQTRDFVEKVLKPRQ